MKVAPVAEVKHRFADFLEKSKREPIFITRNGRIAAVLEGISDDEVEDDDVTHGDSPSRH